MLKSVLVIGGVNAKPGAWPWQVKLVYHDAGYFGHFYPSMVGLNFRVL